MGAAVTALLPDLKGKSLWTASLSIHSDAAVTPLPRSSSLCYFSFIQMRPMCHHSQLPSYTPWRSSLSCLLPGCRSRSWFTQLRVLRTLAFLSSNSPITQELSDDSHIEHELQNRYQCKSSTPPSTVIKTGDSYKIISILRIRYYNSKYIRRITFRKGTSP